MKDSLSARLYKSWWFCSLWCQIQESNVGLCHDLHFASACALKNQFLLLLFPPSFLVLLSVEWSCFTNQANGYDVRYRGKQVGLSWIPLIMNTSTPILSTNQTSKTFLALQHFRLMDRCFWEKQSGGLTGMQSRRKEDKDSEALLCSNSSILILLFVTSGFGSRLWFGGDAWME